MVPISKNIYQNSPQEYRLRFFIVLAVNFLCISGKNLFRNRSELSLPNFSSRFCAVCLNIYDFLLKSCFLSMKVSKSARPPAAELCRTGGLTQEIIVYMFVYILLSFPGSRLLRGVLFGSVDENGQHCNGKDDADGVSHSGIVNGSALSGLAGRFRS